jgi:hypothetical protein
MQHKQPRVLYGRSCGDPARATLPGSRVTCDLRPLIALRLVVEHVALSLMYFRITKETERALDLLDDEC